MTRALSAQFVSLADVQCGHDDPRDEVASECSPAVAS